MPRLARTASCPSFSSPGPSAYGSKTLVAPLNLSLKTPPIFSEINAHFLLSVPPSIVTRFLIHSGRMDLDFPIFVRTIGGPFTSEQQTVSALIFADIEDDLGWIPPEGRECVLDWRWIDACVCAGELLGKERFYFDFDKAEEKEVEEITMTIPIDRGRTSITPTPAPAPHPYTIPNHTHNTTPQRRRDDGPINIDISPSTSGSINEEPYLPSSLRKRLRMPRPPPSLKQQGVYRPSFELSRPLQIQRDFYAEPHAPYRPEPKPRSQPRRKSQLGSSSKLKSKTHGPIRSCRGPSRPLPSSSANYGPPVTHQRTFDIDIEISNDLLSPEDLSKLSETISRVFRHLNDQVRDVTISIERDEDGGYEREEEVQRARLGDGGGGRVNANGIGERGSAQRILKARLRQAADDLVRKLAITPGEVLLPVPLMRSCERGSSEVECSGKEKKNDEPLDDEQLDEEYEITEDEREVVEDEEEDEEEEEEEMIEEKDNVIIKVEDDIEMEELGRLPGLTDRVWI